MSTHRNDPAFPAEERRAVDGHESVRFHTGMSKREYVATIALQGLLANAGTSGSETQMGPLVTGLAVALADQLLDALSGEQS
jgi:hypothetical protein